MAQSDQDLYMLIGELKGQLDGVKENLGRLVLALEEDRKEARTDRQAMLNKLNRLDMVESDVTSLKERFDNLKRQVYSNKAEIDSLKSSHAQTPPPPDLQRKPITPYEMGVVGVFGSALLLMGSGLTYLAGHWGDLFTVLKSLPPGKP